MKVFATLACALLFPGIVAAQSSSLFPSSGGGSTGGGSTGSSSLGGGTAGSAASSVQQSLGGGGGGGLSGQSGTFGTGELQGPQFTQFGEGGAAVMNQEFVGVGQTGQFVGVGQTATGSGQTSQQGLAGLGNRGQGQGQGQSQGRSTTSTGRSRVERLQPIARIAFDYQPATTAFVQTRLETQFSEYDFGVDGLAISLNDEGVLTLSGVAPTDDARRLAEAYMRLEPGVRTVENQIIIAE